MALVFFNDIRRVFTGVMSTESGGAVQPFVGQDVVLDTRGELLYIGRLEKATDWFLELADADVHDLAASRTTKELYIMDAAKHGVKKNRKLVTCGRSRS
jgi:hypothetical protein